MCIHDVKYKNGRASSSCCGDVTDRAKNLAAAAALGAKVPSEGCTSLAALVNYGLPTFVERGGADTSELGVWREAYIRFESFKIVQSTLTWLVEKRVAASKAQVRIARTNFLRVFTSPEAKATEIVFRRRGEVHAWFRDNGGFALDDCLRLPDEWVDNVFCKLAAVVDDHFVVDIMDDKALVIGPFDKEEAIFGVRWADIQLLPHPTLKVTK